MRLALLLSIAGCAHEASTCDQTCSELVTSCDYAAYPSFASCQQGCAYWEEQGVDVEGYLGCVEQAECNTFDIVECEHAYGPDAQ
jgi:hypothetical protein